MLGCRETSVTVQLLLVMHFQSRASVLPSCLFSWRHGLALPGCVPVGLLETACVQVYVLPEHGKCED